MFTILNIINYLTGKYIPLTLLILITIGIYYYIMTYCYDTILFNEYYIITLLILLLLDITSLIVIFIYGDFAISSSKKYLNVNTSTTEKEKKRKILKLKNTRKIKMIKTKKIIKS